MSEHAFTVEVEVGPEVPTARKPFARFCARCAKADQVPVRRAPCKPVENPMKVIERKVKATARMLGTEMTILAR